MSRTTAVISLLHQPAVAPSVERRFRGEPVLSWTLRRLKLCRRVEHVTILCWEDQAPCVQPIASAGGAFVLAKGPRLAVASIDAVTAAQRWSDGWRGGLLGTTCFDRGFHALWMSEVPRKLESDAVLLVDGDAGLVDPSLLDAIVDHARQHPQVGYAFTPAAPGLGGALLRLNLLDQLAASQAHPGRLMNYWPDLPGRDPISGEECAPYPTPIARTPHRFTLDSQRQIALLERSTESLNGTLLRTEAEALVERVRTQARAEPFPRDVILELNAERSTRPVYSPATHMSLSRPELSIEQAKPLFDELAGWDDVRLTLGGVGDPLIAPGVFDVIAAARSAGIAAIHVETDLLDAEPGGVERLVECGADIVSVFIPAATPAMYRQIMGIDAYARVGRNIERFLHYRAELQQGTPILVPTFVKCRENMVEMEDWYDHWHRAVGCAVIVGPTDCAGQISDAGAVDMTPPKRVPCRRLRSRLTVLSDGRIVSCEEDVAGLQALGRVGEMSIAAAWQAMEDVRLAHARLSLEQLPLCRKCREWHRS